MKLYRAYNGFTGFSAVHCLVIAKNQENAVLLAVEEFKKASGNYGSRYYENVQCELVFSDLTIEQCTEPED